RIARKCRDLIASSQKLPDHMPASLPTGADDEDLHEVSLPLLLFQNSTGLLEEARISNVKDDAFTFAPAKSGFRQLQWVAPKAPAVSLVRCRCDRSPRPEASVCSRGTVRSF